MSLDARLLVVDDEPLVVEATARLLRRLDWRVDGCTSPFEAFEQFERDPQAYDAAVVDYRMREMSGLVLAEKLLVLRPDLPVVLVTGYVHDVDLARAQAIGVRQVAAKPLTREEFQEALAKT